MSTRQTSIDPASLSPLLARLSESNAQFAARFPGPGPDRQPVHTVYGGANLYKPGAANKLGQLARQHFERYAADYTELAAALSIADVKALKTTDETLFGSPTWLAKTVFERVNEKLRSEPIEDHRADFEDGYGARSDEEEDGHAIAAADAMAEGLAAGSLPAFVGIRIKSLTEEAKQRALRTLDLFVTRLVDVAGKLPAHFCVTLPKVISTTQVDVLATYLGLLEQKLKLPENSIKIELMLENVQRLFNDEGKLGLRELVDAGKGRVTCVVLGTFDYTATCNVAASFQSHKHPAADFARQMMLADLMGSEVRLCDGITNIMPIPPHKGDDLTAAQLEENKQVVHSAWQLHFDNILHSMTLGIYQGWDLNPAQVPVRFSAVFYFYLKGLAEAQARLKTFIDKAAQASMVGNTFDDAATGQGLVNFFVNGISCGALTDEDALATGITLDELQGRSFMNIVANRTGGQ